MAKGGKILLVVVAVGLFLTPVGAIAGPADEIHAYALALEVLLGGDAVPARGSCSAETGVSVIDGWTWISRDVVFLGPPGVVGSSGIETRDVTVLVCNGDTPQQIREKLTTRIQESGASRGYTIKPVNIVVPGLQRGK
jgi:hypothetical protein